MSFSFSNVQAVMEKSPDFSLPKTGSPANFGQTILQGKADDPSILLGKGNVGGNLALPKVISENYTKQQFDGYLIKLTEPTLIEKEQELRKQIEKEITPLQESLTKTSNNKKKISLEKKISELQIKKNQEKKDKVAAYKQQLLEKNRWKEEEIKKVVPQITVKQRFYTVFNGLSIKVSENEAKLLKQKGYDISPNYLVKATLMDSVNLIGAKAVWEKTAKQGQKITGQGIKIGIIDTGVDYTHSDLGGCLGEQCKIAGGYDFVNYDADPMDDMGHGTHVAAIAAGNGVLKGVAPDAKIYAYKVLNADGWGSWDSVIAGIERSADPDWDGDFSDHLDVINLSLGGWGDPDDFVSQSVDRVVDLGVVSVVAAGNSGPNSQTIGTPGAARNAITVAASDKQDQIAWFSSRGPVVWDGKSIVKPDITAPGVLICAALRPGFEPWTFNSEYQKCFDDNHVLLSGTSMAAPHIAGTVALLKQVYPNWSPEQIKQALKNNAKNISWNQNVLEQGEGRVEAFKTVKSTVPTLMVKIEPISAQKTGIVPINFHYFSEGQPTGTLFQTLSYSSTKYPEPNGILRKTAEDLESYDLNLSELPDGEYILKTTVSDAKGRTSTDYGYFKADKFQVTNPLNYDVLRAGDNIIIQGKYNDLELAQIPNVKVEYGAGEWPNEWILVGMNNLEWDTSSLTTGFYNLRVSIDQGSFIDQKSIVVYLDSTLKQGWPKRIDMEKVACPWEGECYDWAGFLEPVVEDINNDGSKEIIVFKGGYPPKLLAYDFDGALLWSANVGTSDIPGGNLSMPVVDDINNDGRKEIFVINPYSSYYSSSELYAFQFNGRPLVGWSNPLILPVSFRPLMMMADLNGDGLKEIIVKPSASSSRQMVVVDSAGLIVSQWTLPQVHWTGSIEAVPAAGNFDEDADLEIVVANPSANAGAVWDENGNFVGYNNEGEIHIFNIDGSEVAGWPVQTEGLIFSSPAVGDVDNNGQEEIVVGLMYSSDIFPDNRYGGVYVFDRNGQIKPGWPIDRGYNFWSAPSLADFDQDGDLEIGASRLGFETKIFHHDGSLVSGWPQRTGWNDYYSSIVGDVNNDNNPDLVTTAGGLYWGGVYAWEFNGQSIPGFYKFTEVDAQAPAVIADIDNDQQVEIIAASDWDYDLRTQRYKMRGSLYVWEIPSDYNSETMHWPNFHQNVQLTGRYQSPLAPSINLLSPNGGENWPIGSSKRISWQIQNKPNDAWISLYLKKGDGTISTSLGQGFADNFIDWIVPETFCQNDVCGFPLMPGSDYKMEVRLYQGRPFCAGFGICPLSSAPVLLSQDESESFTISEALNRPPVITGVGGPTNLAVDEIGTWKVRAYDPDGTYLFYNAEWGDEQGKLAKPKPTATQGNVQEATFMHNYSLPGTYKVIFTVSDNEEANAQTSITVNVSNYQPPVFSPVMKGPEIDGE